MPLLKLAPTGSAFIGLLVGPAHTGKGIGRSIVAYLYWHASLRSHQAVADFAVIAELPNDYLLIEFPRVGRDRPVLGLQKSQIES